VFHLPIWEINVQQRFCALVLVAAFVAACCAAATSRADDYTIDPVHSGVNFRISHLGLSWVHGRFNDFKGKFVIDAKDAGKCSFELSIKVDSIDTGNAKRDGHLKSGDFFNAKQFPSITFKSTAVTTIKEGYEVTGNFNMHGVEKKITFPLVGGRTAEFPKGTIRTGYSAELVLKRSDFGMDKMLEALSDNVYVAISFEGIKK